MLRRLRRQTGIGLFLLLASQFTCQAWALNWEQSAISGQDNNNDGIRDDVGTFIESHWQADDLRHWAREAARASQAYINSGGNRFALHRAHAFMERSRRCLSEAHGPQLANTVINRVLRMQLDTYERKQRYKEAVDQWVHKVSREDLPSNPDDNWNPACGPGDTPSSPQLSGIPRPQADTDNDNLPPPNFFITRAMPEPKPEQPAVKFLPLPDTNTDDDASPKAGPAPSGDVVTTPTAGSWTTYAPRQREPKKAANRDEKSKLPVQKLRDGESARVAERTAARPQPRKPVVREPASQPIRSKPQLPAALQELAPFIQGIEQR